MLFPLCAGHSPAIKPGLMRHQVDDVLHARLSSSHVLSVVICHNLVVSLCLNFSVQAVPQRLTMSRQGRYTAVPQPPDGQHRAVEQVHSLLAENRTSLVSK